ncbi:transcription elongation factor A N-terminal and central domain-containing protein [Synchiropus splendidus]|uniref:transcription elongation factor A N-terminal and central domain-containing protein n=1 Tax=Synchiropus splendidus TaxID=270530 RepID=UPI00237E545D|nr:transcription elongation factor A N-terminal and central domain-containing protein [Synchiropus splendidus]
MKASELTQCARTVERLAAAGELGDVLTLLGDLQRASVSQELLEETDVVQVLYRVLRSCRDGAVRRTVKTLLSRWKRQFSRGRPTATSSQHEKRGPGEQAADADLTAVRSKCVQLLLAALAADSLDQTQAAQLAAQIELHIHSRHATDPLKYKACVRSKVANLRNTRNHHLRRGLLAATISPEAFARMTAEEMASPELRQLRKEFSSQGLNERQLPAAPEGVQTQKVRCKGCSGTDCRVSQVSRGALFLPSWVRPDDEAMTFVTCSGCGQQWYHSSWVCL